MLAYLLVETNTKKQTYSLSFWFVLFVRSYTPPALLYYQNLGGTIRCSSSLSIGRACAFNTILLLNCIILTLISLNVQLFPLSKIYRFGFYCSFIYLPVETIFKEKTRTLNIKTVDSFDSIVFKSFVSAQTIQR